MTTAHVDLFMDKGDPSIQSVARMSVEHTLLVFTATDEQANVISGSSANWSSLQFRSVRDCTNVKSSLVGKI